MPKYTVVVTLKKKPEKQDFSLVLYPAAADKGLPYPRVFLANGLLYDIEGVVSVTVNGVEVPEDVYVSKTRDLQRMGLTFPRCGFQIRDEVELQDFKLVMKYDA